jgi:hypothetical protein
VKGVGYRKVYWDYSVFRAFVLRQHSIIDKLQNDLNESGEKQSGEKNPGDFYRIFTSVMNPIWLLGAPEQVTPEQWNNAKTVIDSLGLASTSKLERVACHGPIADEVGNFLHKTQKFQPSVTTAIDLLTALSLKVDLYVTLEVKPTKTISDAAGLYLHLGEPTELVSTQRCFSFSAQSGSTESLFSPEAGANDNQGVLPPAPSADRAAAAIARLLGGSDGSKHSTKPKKTN